MLQRSLERGRLGHAYLFTGGQLEPLEHVAVALAQTLNCTQPERRGGQAVDACGQCSQCRRIASGTHPDVHWRRPESKVRHIKVEHIRELMREIQLHPGEAAYKVAIIAGADRLKTEGANAFLKTLEEPPARCVIILLSTEPQRLLETILSRCLRLNFGGEGLRALSTKEDEWLRAFAETAAREQKSLLARYRLLDVLLTRLSEMRGEIEKALTERSPLERYQEIEKGLADQWEDELAAAIEAEYRRQRADLIGVLQWWFRDVWLKAIALSEPGTEGADGVGALTLFPGVAAAEKLASRISEPAARENLQTLEQLQRRLHSNVQEALALEVGLLRLRL